VSAPDADGVKREGETGEGEDGAEGEAALEVEPAKRTFEARVGGE